MTLPSSGPLSLSDIQGEFGGSNPIGINEYYAGGGLVPAGTSGTYGAVPTSGQISIQNFYGTSNFIPIYIEDVFSTYLYTGNSSTQTITNGINLSGQGGLVWMKDRTAANSHQLYDTARGVQKRLMPNQTAAQGTETTGITAFNSNGWTMGAQYEINDSAAKYASWTFRKQPKFFDIVTYTGNGVDGRTISHNLGSTPGFMLVKCTSNGSTNWLVYHRSAPNGIGGELLLNSTAAASTLNCATGGYFGSITSTSFRVFQTDPNTGNNVTPTEVNVSGYTYVAYLFAHNAGGFGLTDTDNVISCGSYNGNGLTNSINLGYEPQWLLIKRTTVAASSWILLDVMRGLTVGTSDAALCPNNSNAEGATVSVNNAIRPTATGFDLLNANSALNATGSDYIYIAIRRGPMKVPTSGTSVFSPNAVATDSSAITTNFPVDGYFEAVRTGNSNNFANQSRLVGGGKFLVTSSTAVEDNTGFTTVFQDNTGYTPGTFGSNSLILYAFRRAPSFFDVVCYTGNGPGTQVINHNLTVVPELVINKVRSTLSGWTVFRGSTTALTGFLRLNDTTAAGGDTLNVSSTTITVDSTIGFGMNTNNQTYVTYLFATCPGVSKVGSYTGTGTTQTINCGFTGGARFVLIKRTNSTGGWYVYDSARGISSGNDPYLFVNSSAAEVTGTNYVDTTSVGFQVTAAAPAGLNANGGIYIFLAIA